MAFRTGYVEDAAGHVRAAFHKVALALGLVAANVFSASLEANMPADPFDQGDTGSCTGHSVAGAIVTAFAATGAPLPFTPSPEDLYKGGRELTRARGPDGKLPALVDEGASPSAVVAFANTFGVRPMRRLPDRNSDADPATINEEQNLAELKKDAEALVVGDYAIFGSAEEVQAQIRQAITNGIPVCVAVPGGSAQWQGYKAGQVLSATGKPNDHYVFIYGYEQQPDGTYVYLIRNSWNGWGDRGNARADESAVAEFSNVIAMSVRRAAPAADRRAA